MCQDGGLLCVCVGAIASLAGYSLGYRVIHTNTTQALERELTHAKHEHGRHAVRERELRSQLEDTLAAQAALAREHQLLQADLAERVRRLEATCPDTSLSPRPSPSH
jgi:hypothetical protein